MKRYYVYMVECSDHSYYIGITNDLERRIGAHNTGWDPKAYTHERRPVSLVYSEEFANVDEAIQWEKHIKRWTHAKKAALAAGDWNAIHALAKRRD